MSKSSRSVPISRKRSCVNCRTAKTRCSLTFPTCTRCRTRRLNCEYGPQIQESDSDPSDTWIQDISDYQIADNAPNNAVSGPDALQTVFSVREVPPSVSQQASRGSGFSDQNGESSDMNWNSIDAGHGQDGPTVPVDKLGSILDCEVIDSDTGTGISNFPQTSDSSEHLRDFQGSSATFNSEILQDIMHDNNFLVHQDSSSMTRSLTTNWPISPVLPKSHPNLLSPKKLQTIGPSLTSKYLLSVLNSYPRILCEKNSLPQFIHWRHPVNEGDCSFPSDKAPSELPECLAICASLAHMYQSRSPASISYIWKTISAEQGRLYSEFRGYDKWKLLSALQAVTTYLIIQASEEKRDNEISIMLVLTMGEMAAKLFTENGYYSITELNGNFPDWDEWVFAESCRRTMMLLFIMGGLLHINIDLTPPTNCSGFDSVPIPCSEELWRAKTRGSWEANYKQYLAGRKGSGLLKFGTLRQSQQIEIDALDKACLEDLQIWATGLDSFGIVVMMFARGF